MKYNHWRSVKSICSVALAITVIGGFVACSSDNNKNQSAAEVVKKEEASNVKIYLSGKPTLEIDSPKKNSFLIENMKSQEALDGIQKYIEKNREALGLTKDSVFSLIPSHVRKAGNRVFVKFDQVIQREINKKPYQIAVKGAGIVITLKKIGKTKTSRLISVNSSLTNPPTDFLSAFLGTGFNLEGLSDNEILTLLGHMKNSVNKEKIAAQFKLTARQAGQDLDIEALFALEIDEQMSTIRSFFSGLNQFGTMRLMITMARKNRLEIQEYQGKWFLVAKRIFDLPVEFDIEMPEDKDSPFMVKNLRNLNHMMHYYGYKSPSFPTQSGQVAAYNKDGDRRGGGESLKAIDMFSAASDYFSKNFEWFGLQGVGGFHEDLHVHTDMAIDNAYWDGGNMLFAIGSGDRVMENIVQSPSVVGHEFAHAMIQFSSGLVYQGQSGALNEHFADIQGVSFEADFQNNGVYDYTIGEDILRPNYVSHRSELSDLIIATNKIGAAEIRDYNLKTLGLRHMYMPELSYSNQQSDMDQYYETYGSHCQPSVDNDYCGVHGASGIPNKASSLIIARFGFENTKALFFNTLVHRLSPRSDFSDYLRQLVEECLEQSDKFTRNDCSEMVAIFGSVGITLPGGSTPSPSPTPKPVPVPTPDKPSTPELTFCGWVSNVNNNVTIIDNKYDAAVLGNTKHYADNLTENRHMALALRHRQCACVKGSISQIQNRVGTWFNYFIYVSDVFDRPTSACAPIEFK